MQTDRFAALIEGQGPRAVEARRAVASLEARRNVLLLGPWGSGREAVAESVAARASSGGRAHRTLRGGQIADASELTAAVGDAPAGRVVLLEDVHLLADELAAPLLSTIQGTPGRLVLSGRDGGAEPGHALAAALRAWHENHLDRVDLEPLEPADLVGLVAGSVPAGALDAVQMWRVASLSVGSPAVALALAHEAASAPSPAPRSLPAPALQSFRPSPSVMHLVDSATGAVSPAASAAAAALNEVGSVPFNAAARAVGARVIDELLDKRIARPTGAHRERITISPMHGAVRRRAAAPEDAARLRTALLEVVLEEWRSGEPLGDEPLVALASAALAGDLLASLGSAARAALYRDAADAANRLLAPASARRFAVAAGHLEATLQSSTTIAVSYLLQGRPAEAESAMSAAVGLPADDAGRLDAAYTWSLAASWLDSSPPRLREFLLDGPPAWRLETLPFRVLAGDERVTPSVRARLRRLSDDAARPTPSRLWATNADVLASIGSGEAAAIADSARRARLLLAAARIGSAESARRRVDEDGLVGLELAAEVAEVLSAQPGDAVRAPRRTPAIDPRHPRGSMSQGTLLAGIEAIRAFEAGDPDTAASNLAAGAALAGTAMFAGPGLVGSALAGVLGSAPVAPDAGSASARLNGSQRLLLRELIRDLAGEPVDAPPLSEAEERLLRLRGGPWSRLLAGARARRAAEALRRAPDSARDDGRGSSDDAAVPAPWGPSVTRPVADLGRPRVSLTTRELEICELVGEGLTNRSIAERLFLSVRTVESHVLQARAKLGARRRRDLPERLDAARAAPRHSMRRSANG